MTIDLIIAIIMAIIGFLKGGYLMADKYVVDGYRFKTELEAKMARNELEGIEYLKKRTNFNDPESVLSVYNKVIEKNLFKTPLGYGFLREMQQILQKSPDIVQDEIQDIPVVQISGNKRKKVKEKRISIIPDEREKKYKNRMTNMVILNVFLVIVIILIIIITNNSENTNILNYRDRLEREYIEKENDLAVWDQQLRVKEQMLKELEENNK